MLYSSLYKPYNSGFMRTIFMDYASRVCTEKNAKVRSFLDLFLSALIFSLKPYVNKFNTLE